MAKKGQTLKKYSPEFKLSVILDMRENKLSYHETMRKYFSHFASSKNFAFLLNWERKYLEEGYEGLMKDNRGRPSVNGKKRGRPPKLDKKVEEDLIAENQRLRINSKSFLISLVLKYNLDPTCVYSCKGVYSKKLNAVIVSLDESNLDLYNIIEPQRQ